MRHLLFSVTKKDLVRQTFRSGGKGGQNQNKVESGVRFIHTPSGARGEARDSRDQKTNEQHAFERLVKSKAFIAWHKLECARRLNQRIPETLEQIKQRIDKMVENDLATGQILVEEF